MEEAQHVTTPSLIFVAFGARTCYATWPRLHIILTRTGSAELTAGPNEESR